MMQFLHNLDTYQADAKATMSGQQPSFEKMERNMQITPPPTVDQFLPEIPKIRPLKEVKKQLKKLIDETYHTYTQLDPRNFCS